VLRAACSIYAADDFMVVTFVKGNEEGLDFLFRVLRGHARVTNRMVVIDMPGHRDLSRFSVIPSTLFTLAPDAEVPPAGRVRDREESAPTEEADQSPEKEDAPQTKPRARRKARKKK